MIHSGSCHCGAVSAEYQTDAIVSLRQDGCGFCSSRGVKSASDPKGRLKIVSRLRLVRYRFAHKTADFLVCPACGTYIAARMVGPRGPVGVLNVVGLAIAELKDEPATLASLESETVDQRIFGDAEWDQLACRDLGWNFVAVGPRLGGIESFSSIYP